MIRTPYGRPWLPLLFAAILNAAGAPAEAQVPTGVAEAISGEVDLLFRPWDRMDSPGAAVLVVRRGEVVHSRGYGMASLEHGIPIRSSTVFDVASVSKQFTAMAVLMLAERGDLSLDDDLRRYLPEMADFDAPIRLRHLLHHTSGLRDWPGALALAGWDFGDVMSYEQILAMAFRQRDLNFQPGTGHAYSNTGYNLLAEVVARVTGQSFRRWADGNLFAPLGMSRTHVHDDATEVVVGRADSYRRQADGYYRVASSLTGVGSSSLFTSLDDMTRWVLNFDVPEVGGRAVIERMHQRGSLDSGRSIDYGYGLSVDSYRGARTLSHGGLWAGFSSTFLRFPEQGLTVVILANAHDLDATAMGYRVADLYLPASLAPARLPPETTVGASAARRHPVREEFLPLPSELEGYAGEYRSAELDASYRLTVEGGVLVAHHFRTGRRPLHPLGIDVFAANSFGLLLFTRNDDGEIDGFTANSDRVRRLRFDRIR